MTPWRYSTRANTPWGEPQRRKARTANSKQQAGSSRRIEARSEQINRRFTQMDTERNPFKNITAEASLDWARDPELVERQRAQRINFLFVGRRLQTKSLPKLELEVLPNRRLPIGQKGFSQRTLRLCGEMSESLCENRRKSAVSNSWQSWNFGAKNIVEVVRLKI